MPRLPLRPLLFLVSFFAFVVLLDAFNRSQSFKLSSLRSTSEGSLRWLPSYGSKAAPSFIPPKPKAAFVILARNFDLPELLPPLASLEQSFNAHPLNNYPYIFLNNHPWQDEFKDKLTSYLNAHRRRVGGPSPAPLEIYFQQIAVEDWEPKNGTINWDKAKIRWGEYKKMVSRLSRIAASEVSTRAKSDHSDPFRPLLSARVYLTLPRRATGICVGFRVSRSSNNLE